MAPVKRRRITPKRVALTVLKILYIILFAISALIVLGFLVFKLTVQPPDVGPGVVDVPIVNPSKNPVQSDDPDTPTDESQTTPEPMVTQMVRKEEFHTFLLIGTDDGNGNADTIMVGAYDVKNNKISVLSVPRDTLVDVSRTVKKINSSYGMGGIDQVLDELQPILGFRPDHYIKVDIRAFVEVVDILGGVSFYVPEDMYHEDIGFIIDLKKGTQWLDGQKALQLVRYRGYQNADLGRIQTQQRFLQQISKQVLSWSTVTKVNEFAQVLSKYFDTDLSVTELAFFGTCALTLDFNTDVVFATLPGHGDQSYKGINWYYELYPDEALSLINATVNPYTTPISSGMVNMFTVD